MIGIVIGTRPELIKLRPVARELKRLGMPCRIIYVPQHQSIYADVRDFCLNGLNEALIQTNYSEPVSAAAFHIAGWLDEYFKAIIVQGDTNSAVAGALAGAYQRLPVIHVEAGLRTKRLDPIGIKGDDLGNATRTSPVLQRIPVPNRAPFPEELNRQLISRVASLHLAPTYGNEQNLLAEDVGGRVAITGNSGITALHDQLLAARDEEGGPKPGSILVTCHRRENWPHIAQLVHELDIVRYQSKRWIVFVQHPNTALYRNLAFGPGFTVSPAIPHDWMIRELRACHLVVTDSGGLIEEATWLGKRRVCLRTETERPEAMAMLTPIEGCHKVILDALELAEPTDGSRYAFGDEKSAERCATEIETFYKELS